MHDLPHGVFALTEGGGDDTNLLAGVEQRVARRETAGNQVASQGRLAVPPGHRDGDGVILRVKGVSYQLLLKRQEIESIINAGLCVMHG